MLSTVGNGSECVLHDGCTVTGRHACQMRIERPVGMAWAGDSGRKWERRMNVLKIDK